VRGFITVGVLVGLGLKVNRKLLALQVSDFREL
jgi:hypothetical protein